MKKLIVLIVLFLGFFNSFSQEKAEFEFDKKTNTALENGKAIYTVEKTGGFGSGEFSVKNIEGKELIYIRFSKFKDEKEIKSSNPEGNVSFSEFVFSNSSSTAEMSTLLSSKNFAKIIYENKLIVNGQLDPSAEERFIKIKGNDFSKRRDAGSNKVIIIDNSNQAPRNGVNINIGH